MSHEDRQLVYLGRLEQFGLLANGQFSYIVLSGAHRSYMRLLASSSVVDPSPHAIGTKATSSPGGTGRRTVSYFVIEGPDIANVVFDSYGVDAPPEDVRELGELERAIERHDEDLLKEYVKSGEIPGR